MTTQNQLMTLFDFSAEELMLNQRGTFSKRQQSKFAKFAFLKLLTDVGKMLLLMGMFLILVVFVPMSSLARIVFILVLVTIIFGLPLLGIARGALAIRSHSVGRLMSVIRPSRTYENRCVVRIARRSFHPKLMKSEISDLKGFYLAYFPDGLDYVASIEHLGDESFDNRKGHLTSPAFTDYSQQRLKDMFDFSQEELRLNKQGRLSERQKRKAKFYAAKSTLFLPLSIGATYGALFYFVGDDTLFSNLFFSTVFLFLTYVWFYSVTGVIQAYKESKLEAVEGKLSFVTKTGVGPGKIPQVYMKVKGVRFAPKGAMKSFPDPTGKYRFHYLAGLNYVLAVELIEPDKTVEYHA